MTEEAVAGVYPSFITTDWNCTWDYRGAHLISYFGSALGNDGKRTLQGHLERQKAH